MRHICDSSGFPPSVDSGSLKMLQPMAKEADEDLQVWRRLNGKVVLVTGASSGLGRELCIELSKAGCNIVAAARRKDRLKSLCEEINGTGPSSGEVKAVPVELDVSDKGSIIEASVWQAWNSFGRIDALINNAGFRGGVHSPIDLPEDEWNKVIATNLTGTWLISKYVCDLMRNANVKGSVINISSIGGIDRGHLPGSIAYTASKTGINAITKIMALELGMYEIRVNSISPGLFKSEITEELMKKEWLHNVALKTIPLRTHGDINPALTSLVQFLIHESSSYVTGNVFIVDAGATLPGIPLFSSL